MKTKLFIWLGLIPCTLTFVGCGNKPTYHKVTKLADYIYEVGDYTSLDYDYADKYFAENYDNWGGGCSAVSTLIDGSRFVGRNMDLNISNKCAYVVRTKASNPDELDTVGLAYTFRDVSPDYSEVEAHNGISDQWYKLLPFMCDDVLNSEGLHIEINMRHAECYPNGEDKFSVDHTTKNPDVRRVYMFEIPRYIGSHCKTVQEAVVYLMSNLNIYNKPGYWNYAYVISDAIGNSVLIEIANYYGNTRIIQIAQDDNRNVMQTNFYRAEELFELQDTKTGLGRLDLMQKNIGSVHSEKDLFALMETVNYFQYYSSNCLFDRRSELIGEAGYLTFDFVYNIMRENQIQTIINNLFGPVSTLTRQQLRDANRFWETTFTEVVDCKNKEIKVKIFEKIQNDDPDPTYLKINLDNTEKVSTKDLLFE